jgi:hypothetical protein
MGHGAEGGRRLHPAHGAGHWHGYELFLVWVDREDDGEAQAVVGAEEHAVEAVLDVVLAEVGGPKVRVHVVSAVEETPEGAAELHGFRGACGRVLSLTGYQEWSQRIHGACAPVLP